MKHCNRIISFVLAVFMLVGCMPSVFAAEHPFADVPTGCWFEESVEYMYQNGYMNGIATNQFGPSYNMNRAMVVTVLYRMDKEPMISSGAPFADVPADAYYTGAVSWARARGIVNGTSETTFSPGNDVTREQMVTIIYRYACYRGFDVSARADLAGFSDSCQVSGYAVDAMQWAVGTGLITGTSFTTLAPNAPANRAQCATFFYRLTCWMECVENPVPEETEPGASEPGDTEPEDTTPDESVPEPTEPGAECGHPNGVETYIAPTCENYGSWSFHCPDCGFEEYAALVPTGHIYVPVVTKPSCTEEGYTTFTCRLCGNFYVDSRTAPLGHDWDTGTVTIEPTEETEGEMTYACQRCMETRSEIIPELEHVHSYDDIVTAPTCVAQGYTTHTCRCGDSFVDAYMAALGHHMGEWSEVTSPSCTENGYEERSCARCDHGEIRVVAATGHDYKAVVVNPTCTEQGYTTNTCHCGDSYADSYVPALDHDMGEWYVVVAATCAKDGQEQCDCTRCDHFGMRAITATGHDYQKGICIVCGAYDPNYVPEVPAEPPVREDGITLRVFEPNVADYLGYPIEDDFGMYYEQAVELYEAIAACEESIVVRLPVDWPAGLSYDERLAMVPEIIQPFRDAFTLNVLRDLSTFGFHSWTVDKHGIVATSKTRFWNEKVISRMSMSDPVFYYQACISAGLYDGMSQKEAVTKISMWICDELVYGVQGDPVKALNGGAGSCNAYSLLFLGMCQSASIDAQYVCGCVNIDDPSHSCSGRGCHAWNRVKIDDAWDYIDVCWVDCTTSDTTSSYFLQENLWADRVIYMTFG